MLEMVRERRFVGVNEMRSWKLPPFQRALSAYLRKSVAQKWIGGGGTNINEVISLIRSGSVPGTVTVGTIRPLDGVFIIDGQQRIACVEKSGVLGALMSLDIASYDSLEDAARHFRQLNSEIRRFGSADRVRPLTFEDGRVRALIETLPFLRPRDGGGRAKNCPDLSALVNSWHASRPPHPMAYGGGGSVERLKEMESEDLSWLTMFARCYYEAVGEPSHMWLAVTVIAAAWMFRRTVICPEGRTTKLTCDGFRSCVSALATDATFANWSRRRTINDLGGIFGRMRFSFARTLGLEGRAYLPSPEWACRYQPSAA